MENSSGNVQQGDPLEGGTAGFRQHNLPLQVSSFIGREREMASIEELLGGNRLLTLAGPGGSGKTRLAIRVAAGMADEFEDGIWLVELASLADPGFVVQEVASIFGVKEAPGAGLLQALTEHLRSQEALLVLDNCEHLIDACAELAGTLLGACPGLRILATSREALGVPGEMLFSVPPLELPDPRQISRAGRLRDFEATALFVDRALAVRSELVLDQGNAMTVAQICYRLDGIPLAIELAAARARVLSVEQISSRLEGSFALLSGGGRTVLPRHRTLRATIEWSYGLLSEVERTLLRRLSVFAGGFTLEAVEAVCAGEELEHGEILDLLASLVDKSLVLVTERAGETRYRLLETVRQYGQERLQENGEEEEVRSRQAAYFLALAQEAEAGLQGSGQIPWLRRLARENDNFRAVLTWLLSPQHETSGERVEAALRIGLALSLMWNISGSSEGYRWMRGALERNPERSTLRARALSATAWLALWGGDYERAILMLEEATALFREAGNNDGAAMALAYLGMAVVRQADEKRMPTLWTEAESLRREPLGDRALAELLFFLGALAVHRLEMERGVELFEQSLALCRKLGDARGISLCIVGLGMAFVMGRDYQRAGGILVEGLEWVREVGDLPLTNYALLTAAAVAAHGGDPERAARTWGAAEVLRDKIGLSLSHSDHVNYGYDARVSAARSKLDSASWEQAWAEGRTMTPEQAVEFALEQPEVHQEPKVAPTIDEYPAGLSAREVDVLKLVARGMTNAQIADELFISSRTVNAHLGSIYNKIGFHSRAEATRFASEHRLL